MYQVIDQEIVAGLLHHAHHDLGLYRILHLFTGNSRWRRVLWSERDSQHSRVIDLW